MSDGTIKFEGETAEAIVDLYQTGVRRQLSRRWTFDGPDKYHEALLEKSGPAGYEPLAEWDRIRSKDGYAARLPAPVEAMKPSASLQAFEQLLGHTWETKAEAKGNGVIGAAGDARGIQSTFKWIPYAEGIYAHDRAEQGRRARICSTLTSTTTPERACALPQRMSKRGETGGVYEGDMTVLDGGRSSCST